MQRIAFLLMIACVPWIVGCEGCRRQTAEENKKEQEEAPKRDFDSKPPRPFPSDIALAGNAIKPGHWLSASQTLKSNNADVRGDLVSRAGSRGVSLRTGRGTESVGDLYSKRPVVMPKGQQRRFDFRVLAPEPMAEQRNCFLASRFTATSQSGFFDADPFPYRMMGPQEYFLVILTTRPERFRRIKEADWVRPFRQRFDVPSESLNYRIVVPPSDGILPLADTMLDWTSTSVVIWDDLPADALTPDQLTAMSDWLQFGGILIVNGAKATGEIAQTVLRDVLPLKPTGNIELDPDAGVELLRNWQVSTDESTEKQIALLKSQSGRVAVDGRLDDKAESIDDSGNLILERRSGNGRVVQPRFDFTSDWISTWQSYDSFISGVLLQRPRRVYRKLDNEEFVRQFYADYQNPNTPASFNTRFRLQARDARWRSLTKQSRSSNVIGEADLFASDPVTGIAGWTDDSSVIDACREILSLESGIEIPKSSLVIKSLGIYLLLLVPVNYLFFRLLGKLEMAWLAVPVIAIGGAVWVARAARLDIGFARSHSEIGILEMQPGYQRGHLTRVMAIYNSLSSNYDIDFKTIDACGRVIDQGRSESSDLVAFKTSYQEGPTLSDVAVQSNQVRLMHVEQMIDLGGGISIDGSGIVRNESSLVLSDAVVIGKDAGGNIRVAVLGEVAAQSAKKASFRQMESAAIPSGMPMQVSNLMRKFTSTGNLPNGASRLVARYDGSIKSMTITPSANQTVSQTVVVVHLKHAKSAEPSVDANLLSDFDLVLNDDDPSDFESEAMPNPSSSSN